MMNKSRNVFFIQIFIKSFCKIHGAMLSSCAAKRHHQVIESPLRIIFNGHIHDRGDMAEIFLHFRITSQEFYNCAVSPCHVGVFRLPAWIWNETTVENKSTVISCIIRRYAGIVKAKTVNINYKFIHHPCQIL